MPPHNVDVGDSAAFFGAGPVFWHYSACMTGTSGRWYRGVRRPNYFIGGQRRDDGHYERVRVPPGGPYCR